MSERRWEPYAGGWRFRQSILWVDVYPKSGRYCIITSWDGEQERRFPKPEQARAYAEVLLEEQLTG